MEGAEVPKTDTKSATHAAATNEDHGVRSGTGISQAAWRRAVLAIVAELLLLDSVVVLRKLRYQKADG